MSKTWPQVLYSSRPLVIVAVGGSGTRVVARIARHCGYFLGLNLNAAEDSRDFSPFLDRYVDSYLLKSKWIQRLLDGNRGKFGFWGL